MAPVAIPDRPAVILRQTPGPVELPGLEQLLGRGACKGRLLVVDDVPEILEIYRFILVREGYHVRTADDGLACLRAARTARPDLILLNYKMPRMDGLEALTRLKKDVVTSYLKVIMHSALGHDHWLRQAALEAGALEVLSVPMQVETLLSAVKRGLRR